jgi:hypothetical protein
LASTRDESTEHQWEARSDHEQAEKWVDNLDMLMVYELETYSGFLTEIKSAASMDRALAVMKDWHLEWKSVAY